MLVVRSEYRHAVVGLDLLKQKCCLIVVGCLVAPSVIGPFGEKRIALVKEQDHVTLLSLPEYHRDGLLGLTDIFVYDLRKIDTVELKVQFVSYDLRAH